HAGGEVPEWPKGADCKSAGVCLRRFESFPLHQISVETRFARLPTAMNDAGVAQLVRASAFQAEGRGFESRFPLHFSRAGLLRPAGCPRADRSVCPGSSVG